MALNAEEAERRDDNDRARAACAGTTRPTLRIQPLKPVAQGSVGR